MTYPHAYHITWGTYGVRLPGSAKPHVTKDKNVYLNPLPAPDAKREQSARDKMLQLPTFLTLAQRLCVDAAMTDIASRYGWIVHAAAPQRDHVHVIITAQRIGQELREALKAVTSRALNKRFIQQKWWAEGGSCKYLFERGYFEAAFNYVRNQREI